MFIRNLAIFFLSSFLVVTAAPAVPAEAHHEALKGQKETREQVRQIQMALRNHGLDPGPIDGLMGPRTQKALRDFQLRNNLNPTGELDHETEAALGIEIHTATGVIPQVGRQKPTMPAPSEDVRQAQIALKQQGYDPGEINGILSAQTQDALRKFQRANNLPITGTIDERTQSALGVTVQRRADVGRDQMMRDHAAMMHANVVMVQLSQNDMQKIHKALEAEGITMPRTGRHAMDMMHAVREFQRKRNLPVTGHLEEQTLQAMNLRIRIETQPSATTRTDEAAPRPDRARPGALDNELRERASNAASVLQELTAARDQRIPEELLSRAEAVAVIPGVIKGAFGIGGRWGKGLVSRRLEGGRWSAPAFIQIGGGSFGAQIGVSSTDLVLVFTDANALNILEGGAELKLGADAAVAAGPIGRAGEAGVNLNLGSAVYAYSRTRGLFAGIALDGSVLDLDDDANRKAYGQLSAQQIFSGTTPVNPDVMPFIDALKRITPKRKTGN
jgi:lipid-binding SYLF domain-containing protein/peptidoglycan hydrolase-like protein with peptidoglycan-binding domain